MTAHSFTDALAVVLKEEGGYVDDGRDPGGATNLGVTARTWFSWSGRPATAAVMRSLTAATVGPLYKAWYWDKVGGDRLDTATHRWCACRWAAGRDHQPRDRDVCGHNWPGKAD